MYLDLGAGGMLVQVLVAVVAIGGVLLFLYRKKIRALFSKNKEEDTDKATTDNINDDKTSD